MIRKPLIAGNWKMFKTIAEARAFADSFKALYQSSDIQVAICPPFTQLEALKGSFKDTDIKIGAQNMHFEDQGAYTGEISAVMLKEIGVDYCIIGHSERRQYFAEKDETINKKLFKAFSVGITPIMCVGESLEERDADRAFEIVKTQLMGGLKDIPKEQAQTIVIAYEPVWAIGTGRTASSEQANQMCGFIRDIIEELYDDDVADKVLILYGGSVKPENATEIMNMEEIDGALVGGASLVPEDFIQIVNF